MPTPRDRLYQPDIPNLKLGHYNNYMVFLASTHTEASLQGWPSNTQYFTLDKVPSGETAGPGLEFGQTE